MPDWILLFFEISIFQRPHKLKNEIEKQDDNSKTY